MVATGYRVASAQQLVGAPAARARAVDAPTGQRWAATRPSRGRSGENGGDLGRASPSPDPRAAREPCRRGWGTIPPARAVATTSPAVVDAALARGSWDVRATAAVPVQLPVRGAKTRIDAGPVVITTATAGAPTSRAGALLFTGPLSPPRIARPAGRRATSHSQATEIYFSPVDVNQSLISLTDPIDEQQQQQHQQHQHRPQHQRQHQLPQPQRPQQQSPPPPEESLAPTQQARYDEGREASRGQHRVHSMDRTVSDPRPRRPAITLKPEQVDRLVQALAACPLLHTHVSRQWWDDGALSDDATVISDSIPDTPSLTSASTLYSQPNQPFMTETLADSVTEEALHEEFIRRFPDRPKATHPIAVAAAATRSTRFGGIALADPKVHGAPIRFISANYRLGTNVLHVGACSFLNILYGTTVQSNLRIEPPSRISVNGRVMLQIVNQVVERRTGQKVYLLVVELDVTESFTKAALTELADHADISLADIQFLTPVEKTSKETSDPFDWCALANEIHESCEVADVVERAASSFTALTPDRCAMQTLTLLSELEQLKTQHQDFLVVRPTGYHRNGMLSGIHIPWISQHLEYVLMDEHGRRGEASKAGRLLRERVVAAVAEGCAGDAAFDTRIWWGDQMRRVHCTPLLEGMHGSRPAVWVCFLTDLGRYGLLCQAFYTLDHVQ